LGILTPEEEQELQLIKLARKNAAPSKVVKETITPEEYQKRLEESLRRDTHVYNSTKNLQIQKSSAEWRKKVGPRFADASTDNPKILDRVRRLESNTGTHKTSIIMSGNLGVGKAQPLKEKILTDKGWTTIGKIKPGDTVISGKGSPTIVKAVHPVKERLVYTVLFSDGSTVEADGEHLWVVFKGFNRYDMLTTLQMLETLNEGHKIPLTGEILIPESLTTQYNWDNIINECLTEEKPLFKHVKVNELVKKIHKQKHIDRKFKNTTQWFLGLHPAERKQIIISFYRNRGAVSTRNTVEASVKNVELAKEIVDIARSLGCYTHVEEDNSDAGLTYVIHSRTSFTLFDTSDTRYNLYRPTPRKELYKTVVNVVAKNYVKTRCITVAAASSTYITSGYTVTHNTWLAYAYINHAVQSGAVTPGQIVADTETAILGKISSSGFRRAELLEELFHPKYKIYFIDDVGQGYFSSEQSRREVWYELLDHVYSHDLTIIITTNKEFLMRNGKLAGSPSLEHWVGPAAYDRLRHIVGSDGVIIPGNVNRRPGVYEKREESSTGGKV
jgi:DNA replication protein DnaC